MTALRSSASSRISSWILVVVAVACMVSRDSWRAVGGARIPPLDIAGGRLEYSVEWKSPPTRCLHEASSVRSDPHWVRRHGPGSSRTAVRARVRAAAIAGGVRLRAHLAGRPLPGVRGGEPRGLAQ